MPLRWFGVWLALIDRVLQDIYQHEIFILAMMLIVLPIIVVVGAERETGISALGMAGRGLQTLVANGRCTTDGANHAAETASPDVQMERKHVWGILSTGA